MALEAGVDLELPRLSAYAGPLRSALESGRVGEALLDEAVGRILRHQVPPRPVRLPVPRRADRGRACRVGRRRGAGRPRARPPIDRPGRQRRGPATRHRRSDGSPSSGRERTARASSSATTATWSTSRPWSRRVGVAPRRSGSSPRARRWSSRTSSPDARRCWTPSARDSAVARSSMPRAPASTTGPTRRSPKPSISLAGPTSPSSWSRSDPG